MEGATGLDTEFVVAGEPFPATIFGYVPGPTTSYWTNRSTTPQPSGNTSGPAPGRSRASSTPWTSTSRQKGGLSLPTVWASPAPRSTSPIDKPWIALSDLNAGDTAV